MIWNSRFHSESFILDSGSIGGAFQCRPSMGNAASSQCTLAASCTGCCSQLRPGGRTRRPLRHAYAPNGSRCCCGTASTNATTRTQPCIASARTFASPFLLVLLALLRSARAPVVGVAAGVSVVHVARPHALRLLQRQPLSPCSQATRSQPHNHMTVRVRVGCGTRSHSCLQHHPHGRT